MTVVTEGFELAMADQLTARQFYVTARSPWATLSEDRKIGWRGDAERALTVVKEYLTVRRPSEQAVTEATRRLRLLRAGRQALASKGGER